MNWRAMCIDQALFTAKAGTLFAALALISCASEEPPRAEPVASNQKGNQRDGLRRIPRVPAKLKPALIALRRGDAVQANELLWTHTDVLENWLSKVLVKGRTTQDDIVTLLGPHLQDLDRPQRDAVVTQQYYLGGSAAFTTLVFDFDARTGLLSDWSTSQAICGFCPHVFADDGRWRLEGKLLAGRIGFEQEGTDTILLPRLAERDGRVRVKLSNLAPEIEFLDRVQLGVVPLQESEELDICHDGRPFVWHARRELNVAFEQVVGSYAEYAVDLPHRSANDVAVLEVRNTSAFETAMRESIFGKRQRPASAEMQIQFAGGASVGIDPIGTKFLRRIVVPVSADSKRFTLRVNPKMWLVRRMWIGTGRSVDSAIRWQSPITARGPVASALRLISKTDQRRLTLKPMQQVEVDFFSSKLNSESALLGFALRMTGYYEFQRRPEIGIR